MSRWILVVTCAFVLKICSVHGQNIMKSSLAIVLDSTGSMEPEISQINANVDKMFEIVNNTKNSPIGNFVLVTFNDPTASLLTVTTDRQELKKYLSNIKTGGGGIDCPEYALSGIKIALVNSLEGSSLYVFTDASASDFMLYDEVRSLALKKQIQINFIVTGQCKSRSDPDFQVYFKLANDTTGEVIPILKSEVTQILEYVMESIKSRRYLLAHQKLSSTLSNSHNYTVDNDISDVIMSITGPNVKQKIIKVTTPDGSSANTSQIFIGDEVMITKLTKPQIGTYLIEITSDSDTYVKVTGKSSINFQCGFSSVPPTSLFETATRPPTDGNTYLSIQLNAEDVSLTNVTVLDMNGNTLEVLSLRTPSEDKNFFVSKSFNPPRTKFRIAVNGYNIETKTPIVRISGIPFERRNSSTDKIENFVPKMTIEGWPKIISSSNASYKLKCRAQGYLTPWIFWSEDDSGPLIQAQVLPIEPPYDYVSILDIGRRSYNSTFKCTVESPPVATTEELQFEVDEYFIVQQSPKDCYNVEYDKEASMSCKVDAYPPATITWYKDKKILSSDSNTVISNDNTSVTIKRMNFDTKGIYSCEIASAIATKVFNSCLNLFGVEKPHINKTLDIVHILSGEADVLFCQITYDVIPKPVISWSYPQQAGELHQEVNKTTSSLFLNNVTTDQAGIYTCSASNYLGSDYYAIEVIIDSFPESTNDISRIQAKAGSALSIPCEVSGMPRPIIEWYHNNKAIENNIRIRTPSRNLQFNNIDQEDAGNYTCVASNEHGSLSKTFYVEVFTPITIRCDYKSTYVVKANSSLTLLCDADGYPKPQISWIYNDFNGKLRMQKLRYNNMSKVFPLLDLQSKDEGFYTCVARNKYVSANLTYLIVVNEYPVQELFYTMNNVTKENTIELQCTTEFKKNYTVIWYDEKQRVISYGNKLKLRNVSRGANGIYRCQFTNSTRSYPVIFNVNIKQEDVST